VDIDPDELRPGDVTTAAAFADRIGRNRSVVNHRRDNGYLDSTGERVYVRPIHGGDCPCGPRTTPVERDDGSISWLITHHSLDGRELTEPDYRG